MKKLLIKGKKKIMSFCAALAFMMISSAPAFANDIMESEFGQGTMKLLNDVSNFTMVIGGVIAIIATIIVIVKKSMANTDEEGAGRGYNKRIIVGIVCGILVFLVGGIMKLVASYYGVSINIPAA